MSKKGMRRNRRRQRGTHVGTRSCCCRQHLFGLNSNSHVEISQVKVALERRKEEKKKK